MNLKNKPPVFVPQQFRAEVERQSKAALMDMAWDMAKQLTPPPDEGGEQPDADVMGTLRHIAEVVGQHRK